MFNGVTVGTVDPGDYQDDDGNLVPELESALKAIGSRRSSPQNREVVENAVPHDVRCVLESLGYIERALYDPMQESHPSWCRDGFDHYWLTLKGRSYFAIRKRRRFRAFTERVLPSLVAFLAAIAGAYIGTGALTG